MAFNFFAKLFLPIRIQYIGSAKRGTNRRKTDIKLVVKLVKNRWNTGSRLLKRPANYPQSLMNFRCEIDLCVCTSKDLNPQVSFSLQFKFLLLIGRAF